MAKELNQLKLFRDNQIKPVKIGFIEFLDKKLTFEVVRIIEINDFLEKSETKSQMFYSFEDAKKWFDIIKMDFVENAIVYTAIFSDCIVVKKCSKIRICKVKKEKSLF